MPTNWQNFLTDFTGKTWDFPTLLDAALKLVRQNVDVVQSDLETSIVALHGRGFEGDGTILTAGSGLSAIVGSAATDHVWVDGRRYATGEAGGVHVALPPGVLRHIYLNAANVPTLRTAKLAETPTGEWYAGSATCDGSSCTAVDDSEADRVSSLAAFRTSLLALAAAVGMPYDNEVDLSTRVTNLEAGATAGEDPISWGALQKLYGTDPTTIVQQITSMIGDHVTAFHAEPVDDGSALIEVTLTRWNSEATRNGRLALLTCRTLNPHIFEHLTDCAPIVWQVYGDGSNGSPNYVDPASTWVYVAP